jgi:light-regulated signal transduction histidine kinase (bacteriophytochrome)
MFRNLTLTNRVPLDLPPLTADVNHLSQILMNLLLNAAQATPAGGSITIAAELERTAGVVELRVTDSGSGIPADILPHIFEPLFHNQARQRYWIGPQYQSKLRSQPWRRHPGRERRRIWCHSSSDSPVHQPGNTAEYREVIV